MTTASERTIFLSGLSGVAASVHWRAMVGATGTTAGGMLFNRSSLRPSATAAAHLLDGDVTPSGGGGGIFMMIRRRRR